MSTEKSAQGLILEERKVKALEKIAMSLDALTLWVEEIDKEEWGDRIQYYLSEFYSMAKPQENAVEENQESELDEQS